MQWLNLYIWARSPCMKHMNMVTEKPIFTTTLYISTHISSLHLERTLFFIHLYTLYPWPRFARIQSRHTFCKISTTSVSILETSAVERKLTLDRENPIALIIQHYATAAWSELSTVINALNRLQPEIFRRVSLGFFKPFSESIKYIHCVFKGLTKTIIF